MCGFPSMVFTCVWVMPILIFWIGSLLWGVPWVGDTGG